MRVPCAINRGRVFDDGFSNLPLTILQRTEKTAFAAGMAGNPAFLANFINQHIAIAIELNGRYMLKMP